MSEPISRVLDVLRRASNLKWTKRAGWLRCGVANADCESVADHTFGVALLALLLPSAARLNVNRDHCIALAIVHDLAESIVGDITPHDGVDAADKRRREEAAIRELVTTLGDDTLLKLWLEFEAGETAEAKLVRELDVVEVAAQARAYERAGKLPAADAERFIASARSRVTSAAGTAALTAVVTTQAGPGERRAESGR